MAATGNDAPVSVKSGEGVRYYMYEVTATGVTDFTIATPCGSSHVVVIATSHGTALTAQPSYVSSTGVLTVTGVNAGDVVEVLVMEIP